MKKIIYLIFFSAFISIGAASQISKGALLLGGDFSFLTSKQKAGNESKNSGIAISPLIGKAIKENLILGGSLNVAYEKSKTTTNYQTVHNAYGIGIFIRKYKNFAGSFYVFLQGSADFLYEKYTYKQDGILDNKNYSTKSSISLSPGLSFKVSKKLHIETGFRQIASIYYQHQKINNFNPASNSEWVSNSFSVYSSLDNFKSNFYVGFRLLIDKK